MAIRIGVIGAGAHSVEHHLPAIAKCRQEHPGEVELAAICDLDAQRAQRECDRYGGRAYNNVDTMLQTAGLDAVMSITPPTATLSVMKQVLAARLPILIEKPPGVSIADARQVAQAAHASGIGVMVSVNRRFEPVIAEGRKWIGQRRIEYLRSTFVRNGRLEPDFITATGIHATDTVRFLADERPVRSLHRACLANDRWRIAMVGFEGGPTAVFEVCPTAGGNAETYEAMGEGFRVIMRSAFFDTGELLCYEGGHLAHTLRETASEKFIRSGTYAETEAFLAAVAGRRPFAPSPNQVIGSLELAWQLFGSAEG